MSKNIDDIKKSRPLSPHLSVYKFPLSAVLSIGHRLSGIGLFLAIVIFCWWFTLWVFSKFDPFYLDILDYNLVKIFLVLATYGFFYHFCTGIRHLIWDTGRGFSICATNYSAWSAIVASFILTASFLLYI